ncbi:MAG: hypothetical protein BGO00_07370 [Alphaproteobacteria bacterium 62-8]|nr:MAG: hypothetical protein BGO00_07370 [Alphaproteobacteria bacterium 62-8]
MQALAEKRQDFLNKTLLDAKTAEAAWIASQDRAAVERLKGLDGYHDALVKQIEDERKAKLAAIDDEYAKEMDALAKLNYAKSSPAYRRAASAIEGGANAKRGAVNTEADASLYTISDTSAINEAIRQGAALVAMYDSEAAALRMTAGEAAKAAYIQQQLNDAKARGIPITKEFTAAVEEEGNQVGAAAQRAQDAQDSNDLREMVRQSFRDGIRTAIEGGDIRDVFANLAQNFADKMADRLGDQLFDLFDKLLDDIFSNSGGSGGGGGGILGFLGSAIGSLFGGGGGGGSAGLDSVPFQLFPRASGGPVTAGQNYLVGEQGPELFSPGRSGTIIPNDALRMPSIPDVKSGSTTPVSIVLNSSYNVQGSNRAEIEALLADHDRKMAKQLPGMVVKTVRDANSRRML